MTRTWNDIGALSSVTDGTNTIASMAYVGFRLKSVTFGNTTTQTNTWTGFREEVSTVNHKNSGGTTLLRLDYGYDKVHTRKYERYGAPGYAGDGFAYDKAQRLTTAWMGSSTPSNPSGAAYVTKLDFAMDDDGNRTSVVTTPYQQSATTVSYTTNALNQYTAVGGTSWTHDANGNVMNNGTLKFEYDYRNQIVRVKDASTNAVVATYRYDALGRRVEKAVSGGATTRFVYDGQDVVEEYDGADVWQASYTFEDAIDTPRTMDRADLSDVDGDADTTEVLRFVYHQNALGSVTEVSAPGGAVVEWVTYDVYGKATIFDKQGAVVAQSAVGNRFLFTGREFDPEIGLYHYRARTYDPATGRFVQRDPAGYVDGMSLYEYSRSTPATRKDSLGLESWKDRQAALSEEIRRAIKGLSDEVKKAGDAAVAKLKALLDLLDARANHLRKRPTCQLGTDEQWEERDKGLENAVALAQKAYDAAKAALQKAYRRLEDMIASMGGASTRRVAVFFYDIDSASWPGGKSMSSDALAAERLWQEHAKGLTEQALLEHGYVVYDYGYDPDGTGGKSETLRQVLDSADLDNSYNDTDIGALIIFGHGSSMNQISPVEFGDPGFPMNDTESRITYTEVGMRTLGTDSSKWNLDVVGLAVCDSARGKALSDAARLTGGDERRVVGMPGSYTAKYLPNQLMTNFHWK